VSFISERCLFFIVYGVVFGVTRTPYVDIRSFLAHVFSTTSVVLFFCINFFSLLA